MNIFSDDLKRFAHAMRVFSIFPLNCGMDYKIFTFAWVWSILIGLVSTIGFSILNSKLFASFTLNNIRFRSFSFFISSIILSKNLPRLIQEVDVFDQHFCKDGGVIRNPLMNRGSVWVLISTISSLSILLMHSLFIKANSLKVVKIIVGCYTYNVRQLWIYLYIFFCFNLKSRFKDVQKKWCKHVDTITTYKYSNNIEKNLEAVRLEYANLCRIVENMSQCFGYHLSLYYITVFLEIINDIFGCIYAEDKYRQFGPYILLNFIVIFVLGWISGEVTREVSNFVNSKYYFILF